VIILVVVAVATVALATAILNARTDDQASDPDGSRAPATPEPPASASPSAGPARLATGCVGGPDPATAVFTAQTQAPADEIGGVEFAAALTRWLFLYPRDGRFEERLEGLVASSTDPETTTALTNLRSREDEVPAGTRFVAATAIGGYRVIETSPEGVTADVAFGITRTIADGSSDHGTTAVRVTVVREDGRWNLAGLGDSPAELAPITSAVGDELTPFVGGC
jgi:hypothetical protein